MQFSDSLMGYYVNQLEALDPTLNEPLVSVTWGRDLPLRTDVTIAHESTSFVMGSFAGGGTSKANGLPVISGSANAIPAVKVDGEKQVSPFLSMAREISFTGIELQRSQLAGAPIDATQFEALQSLYQMDADRMAYVGNDSVEGLVNSQKVETGSLGAHGTADEWLTAIDEVCSASWKKAGYAVAPDTLLVPTTVFSALGAKLDNGSGLSIMEYVVKNALSSRLNGRPLAIRPVKWCDKEVSGLAKNRIVAYSQNGRFVKFPITPLVRQTPYFHGISYNCPYVYGIGGVEFRYPETVAYRDL